MPALCEMFDQPYTFSDPLTCAVTLDKALAKRLVRDHGLPTAPFVVVERPEDAAAVDLPLAAVRQAARRGEQQGGDAAAPGSRPATELAAACAELIAHLPPAGAGGELPARAGDDGGDPRQRRRGPRAGSAGGRLPRRLRPRLHGGEQARVRRPGGLPDARRRAGRPARPAGGPRRLPRSRLPRPRPRRPPLRRRRRALLPGGQSAPRPAPDLLGPADPGRTAPASPTPSSSARWSRPPRGGGGYGNDFGAAGGLLEPRPYARVVIAHNPVGADADPSTSDVLAQVDAGGRRARRRSAFPTGPSRCRTGSPGAARMPSPARRSSI